MSYGQNPYGQNPYGQNPYGQPGSQPSAPWNNSQQGQPGFGGPQAPQGGQPWGQPSAAPAPWQPGQPGQAAPGAPGQGGQPWGPPQGQPAGGQPGQRGQQWGQPPAQPVPSTPVPEPEPRKAEFRKRDLLVTTTESLPGHTISEVLGEVVGVVTRPRDMKPNPDLKVMLTETRQDAVDALVEMASAAGAQAVIGLRFDGGKINAATSEVTAYGTAVKLEGAEPAAEEPEAEENPFVSEEPSSDESAQQG